jgi:putative phosphoribosyl transferase
MGSLPIHAQLVWIPTGDATLDGDLTIPADAKGMVVFAHGSGSSRHSPRNKFVAERLQEAKLATLLFDLLTPEEEEEERSTGYLRFDVELLARRLAEATEWLVSQEEMEHFKVGYFGASTGAAAALIAAASRSDLIHAVVSRGGRPDLAGKTLPNVKAPTLLIVGSNDEVVLDLNREAYAALGCEKKLEIVAGATHLFEEPGALNKVSDLARHWFTGHFERH